MIFRRGDDGVQPGSVVLVEDAKGNRYVRVYALAADGGWIAKASSQVYPSFEAERHGLKVVAVMQWVAASVVRAG